MSENAMTCCGSDASNCCDTNATPLREVRPAVDVVERDDAWLLVADVPGVVPDSVDLTIEGGELRLTASQPVDESVADGFVVHERRPLRFVRNFRLGEGIDTKGIAAHYESGVLTVTLPKAAELQARRIEVGVG